MSLDFSNSFLITSESTEFGNSNDDTHLFIGDITASDALWMSGGIDDSGTSITASGNIYGRNLVSDSASFSTRFENVTASLGNVTSSIQFITASIGNITASIDTISDNQSFATSSIADITASIATINQNQTYATNSIADITASIDTLSSGRFGSSNITASNISASDVVLGGTSKGNVNSDVIKIKSTAEVDGVLNQKNLSIEEGAKLKIKAETY